MLLKFLQLFIFHSKHFSEKDIWILLSLCFSYIKLYYNLKHVFIFIHISASEFLSFFHTSFLSPTPQLDNSCYNTWAILFSFFFLRQSHTLISQVGVQWCHHSSLQPQLLGPRWSYHLSLPSSWNYKYEPSCQAIFCIFSRDTVSPCCPGFSQSPGIKWSAHLDLPKC